MTTENPRPEFRLSHNNRVIAGVCGGLAEFTGAKTIWFRLAFIVATLLGGVPGIAAYIIFWAIAPKEHE